jgi:hypothetical protein
LFGDGRAFDAEGSVVKNGNVSLAAEVQYQALTKATTKNAVSRNKVQWSGFA